MRTYGILVISFFVIFVNSKSLSFNNRISLLAESMKSIIDSNCFENHWKINLRFHGQDSRLLVELFLSKTVNLPPVIAIDESLEEFVRITRPHRVALIGPKILIFRTVRELAKVGKNIDWQLNQGRREKHLVVFLEGSPEALQALSKLDLGFGVESFTFLLPKDENSIDLYTSYMFTPQKCHQNQLVRINSYERSKKSWATNNFFPRKYENFHGCVLTVEIAKFFAFNIIGDGTYDFLRMAAKKLNFVYKEIDYVLISRYHRDNDTGFSVELGMTHPKFREGVVVESGGFDFIVPPGEPYSALEQMFLPFDFAIWMLILFTFVVSLVVIQVIDRFPLAIRNFVFGRGIRTPTVNLCNTFLTGSQHKIPGRNFSRFLLTMFIIWSLIIRTCYQSLLFTFLQGDPRKPVAKTLDELYERNYTFLMDHFITSGVEMGDNRKDLDLMRFPAAFNPTKEDRIHLVIEPENKFFTFQLKEMKRFIHSHVYRSGTSSVNTFEVPWITQTYSFNFRPYTPYFQELNYVIFQAFEAGLTRHWCKKYFGVEETKPEEIGPQVLTMEHLTMSFIVCMIPMGISFIVFLGEITEKRFKILLIGRAVEGMITDNIFLVGGVFTPVPHQPTSSQLTPNI